MLDYLKQSDYKVSLFTGTIVGITSTIVGAIISFTDVWIALGIVISIGFIIWSFIQSEVALWSAIIISCLLPFGTLPIKLIITPTLLDVAVITIYLVFLVTYIPKFPKTLSYTPVHIPIMIFILLSIVSFILGLGNAAHSLNIIRKFTVFVLNIGLSIIIVEQINEIHLLNRILKVVIYSGFAAATIGIILYYIPIDLSQQILNYLGVLNYPTGDILRYIEDNPENPLRAIGTSVDPNIFGGLLAVVGTILVPQVITKNSLSNNKLTSIFMLITIIFALFLTYSRTAMASFLISTLFILFTKNRRLLWIVVMFILTIVLLPWSQQYLSHFIQGLTGQDLATNMRFGEYKDALVLISRYPVFGVGFGGTPDVDVYLGVSSAYLLLSEQMGLLGFTSFVVILISLFIWGIKEKSRILLTDKLSSEWLGLYGALLTTTIIGTFDHYFVNLEFQGSQTFFWIIVGFNIATIKLSQKLK